MSSESKCDANDEPTTNLIKNNKKLPLSSFYEESTKYELKLPRTWLILMTIRIALNVFFQRGYIHPDEFFQGNSLPDIRSKNKLGIGWHPNFEST